MDAPCMMPWAHGMKDSVLSMVEDRCIHHGMKDSVSMEGHHEERQCVYGGA